jgi:hypothetical protein
VNSAPPRLSFDRPGKTNSLAADSNLGEAEKLDAAGHQGKPLIAAMHAPSTAQAKMEDDRDGHQERALTRSSVPTVQTFPDDAAMPSNRWRKGAFRILSLRSRWSSWRRPGFGFCSLMPI